MARIQLANCPLFSQWWAFSCIIRIWNSKINSQSFSIPDSMNSCLNFSQVQQDWICPQPANLNSTPFGIPWSNAITKSWRISHERSPERSTPRNSLGRGRWRGDRHWTHFHDVRIWHWIWSQTKIWGSPMKQFEDPTDYTFRTSDGNETTFSAYDLDTALCQAPPNSELIRVNDDPRF